MRGDTSLEVECALGILHFDEERGANINFFTGEWRVPPSLPPPWAWLCVSVESRLTATITVQSRARVTNTLWSLNLQRRGGNRLLKITRNSHYHDHGNQAPQPKK